MYLDIILVENTCVLKRANNNEIYLLEIVQVIPVNELVPTVYTDVKHVS